MGGGGKDLGIRLGQVEFLFFHIELWPQAKSLISLSFFIWINQESLFTQPTHCTPGGGRSPGGGHSNMLQYSYLENPTDRGAWQEIVHGVTKSQTQLKRLSMHTLHQSNEMFYKPPWTCLTYNRHTTSFSLFCFYSFASKYRFLAEHFLSQCHWPGPHLSVESHTCPDPYNFLKNIFLPKQAPSLLSILRTTTMVLSRYQHNFVMTHGLQNRFSSVQSLSRVRLFATPRIAARQASLSITNSRSSPKLMSIVGDAIQPSHPLLSPFPPVPSPSQHQGLFKWVSSLHEVAKVLEFQLQHQSFQWTPRTDLF